MQEPRMHDTTDREKQGPEFGQPVPPPARSSNPHPSGVQVSNHRVSVVKRTHSIRIITTALIPNREAPELWTEDMVKAICAKI